MRHEFAAIAAIGELLLVTGFVGGCTRAGFGVGELWSEASSQPRDAREAVDLPRAAGVLFADDFGDATIKPAWTLWRMQFAQQEGRLNVKPAPREGFNYGQSGNGRGAQATVGIGNTSWRDYRVTLTVADTGVNPTFDPYKLCCTYRAIEILFRVAKATESWNDPAGWTFYVFGVVLSSSTGEWSLSRVIDNYIPGTGWSSSYVGESRQLVKGSDAALRTATSQFQIDVVGARLIVRVNGKPILDHVDTAFTSDAGVTRGPILYGGVGVRWAFETVGWLDDFSVTSL